MLPTAEAAICHANNEDEIQKSLSRLFLSTIGSAATGKAASFWEVLIFTGDGRELFIANDYKQARRVEAKLKDCYYE